ncbi:MAG TPA: aromatic ring-hydroxylating dioxygenase subunit alpha [Ramlibacter sp.]|nr:aromatic ring-hydroxylating dioxygenase subunit alpha [Ramlibacter sp.]
MAYLRNCWYVAAMQDELPAGELLARTFLEEPVVLFRDAMGSARALHDRCAHRFAPLSEGTLCDGGAAVQCRYHGLRFDGQGACVHNPQGPVPKAAVVRRYPVREQGGLVWIWVGEAAPDESSIPDYGAVTAAPEHATIRGYMPTACHYELFVDNILDLSHVDFLHPTTLGSGALSRTRPEVSDPGPRSVRIAWLSSGDAAPAAFDAHLREQGRPTDQWTEVMWTAPSTMLLRAGATLQGEPREAGVATHNLHLATPETAATTHYWYWSTRDFAVAAEANAFIRPIIEGVFANEDKPMLEMQQRRIGSNDFWSLKPVLLPADAGAARVRRKLRALIDAENSA